MTAPVQLDWLAESSFARVVTHPPKPRARRADPSTSHAAADKAASFAGDHEARILAAIKAAGAKGATYKEVAAAIGLEPVAVGRRLKGMERQGLIARRVLPAADTEHGAHEQRSGCAIWRSTT